jgi:hypothetical protein
LFNIGPGSARFFIPSLFLKRGQNACPFRFYFALGLADAGAPLRRGSPAPGNPSGFSWPSNWPGSSNGVVSHGNPSGNGDGGDGWNGQPCGGHAGGHNGGGGQWNGGGGWPQTVTVTTDWLDYLQLDIELFEKLTQSL